MWLRIKIMNDKVNEYIKQQLKKLNLYSEDMTFKYEYISDKGKVFIFITNKDGLRYVIGEAEDIHKAINIALKGLVSRK